MDNLNDKPEDLERILQETYRSTAPPDSWRALRERIDTTLSRAGERRDAGRQQVVFWRRTALTLAACFVLAAGLLLHMVFTNRRVTSLDAPALLTQAQVAQLVRAFSEARSLFADHQPWLMIDSAGNTQMGLTPRADPANRKESLIVLRLLVEETGGRTAHRYADLVAYPRQQIAFAMQTTAGSVIELGLTPTLRKDGRVEVDFTVQGEDGSRTGRISHVGREAFSPLAQVKMGTYGLSLGAMAKPVQLSEQG